MQNPGDRVLIGLDQTPDQWRSRQVENPLLPTALLAGYKFIKKRRLDEKRFPGYPCWKDQLGRLVARTEDAREFIFEKTDSPLPSSQDFSLDLTLLFRDYRRLELSQLELARVVKVQTEIDELEVVVEKGAEDSKKGGRCFRHYIVCETDSDSSSYYSES